MVIVVMNHPSIITPKPMMSKRRRYQTIPRESILNRQSKNTTIAKNTTAMLCCILPPPLCFVQFLAPQLVPLLPVDLALRLSQSHTRDLTHSNGAP